MFFAEKSIVGIKSECDILRIKHYSPRTEQAYVNWIKRFILYHNKRHPRDMGMPEISAFLVHLAVVSTFSVLRSPTTRNPPDAGSLWEVSPLPRLHLPGPWYIDNCIAAHNYPHTQIIRSVAA